ncbi:MAG: xanthine dehydrogenase family protein subunit M [Acidobacteria bacterium]|nr:xanthine dehydrogenase family protein subunit M [Acidobacteriota bacterium]
MNDFRYLCPKTCDEFWEMLDSHPGALILAGGTDLVVQLRRGMHRGAPLIDPSRLLRHSGGDAGNPDGDFGPFSEIRQDGRHLAIGAFTTFSEILAHPTVKERFPVFWEACRWIGSRQIRNMATLGGNLANASPAGDSMPPLLLYGAAVVIRGRRSRRETPLEGFYQGYKQTALGPGDLIEAVRLPLGFAATGSYYRKAGPRKALAISRTAVCGAVVRADGEAGARARLAAGGVAAFPVRLKSVENLLDGGRAPGLDELREALEKDISPITDIRGDAAYKFRVTLNFVREFLERAGIGPVS